MGNIDLMNGIIAAIGVVCAVIALFQSRRANKAAKDANTLAKRANEISIENTKIADGANEIAKTANDISEHANTISKRALSTSQDQTMYRWQVQYHSPRQLLTVVNDGISPALNVAIVVRCENDLILSTRRDRLEPFEQLIFEGTTIDSEIIKQPQTIVSVVRTINTFLRVSITWDSELGKHFSLEGQKLFRHGENALILTTGE